MNWSSNPILPEYNLFIYAMFVVFSLEMNFEFDMLFQQLKYSIYF